MNQTLILTRSDLNHIISLDDMIQAIETAFCTHGEGKSFGVDMVHGETPSELEFHIKTGGLQLGEKRYYGVKVNGSCFTNRQKHNLPNILGTIVLFDGETGFPLAIVDSIVPTILRTGAGTAVALKYLARKNSKNLAIFGCGTQGRVQLRAALRILPITHVFCYDISIQQSQNFSLEMTKELGIPVEVGSTLTESVNKADVIITCTPSKRPYLTKEMVKQGTTIAAIGADSPDKQELDSSLLHNNKVVVDILTQCAKVGELHHALDAKLITLQEVHGEIGQVVSHRIPGRESEDEIIIYDATGTAIQDTAAVAFCYEKALHASIGHFIDLFN